MSKHVASFVTLGLAVCAQVFQPAKVWADTIPNIGITAATGYACWGASCAPEQGNPTEIASFSGPHFTFSFITFDTGHGSPYAFSARAGDPFGGYFDGQFSAGANGEPDNGSGTLTVAGHTYYVGYSSNPYVQLLGSATVPNGYETIELPAVLTGGGLACSGGIIMPPEEYSCFPPPPEMVSFIANVGFNVPGFATVRFSPTSLPLYSYGSEYYVATFTPVPEPSSAWLLVAGLVMAAGSGAALRRAPGSNSR